MARTSIYVDAFGHANPIPSACRVGNILTSGIVYGLDPATGKVAPTLEEQCALMFRHMRDIVEAGGGSPHANTMPSVGLGYIICTVGEFPVQN